MTPHLLEQPAENLVKAGFSAEAVERAKKFIQLNPTGVGPYSHSKGFESIRREVAAFIERRDGFPADPENIFLTNGASEAIKMCISLLSNNEGHKSVFMLPSPQYPLYAAALTLNGSERVMYNLHEEDGWSLRPDELEGIYSSYHEAHPSSIIKAMVVINPNNPCGSVLAAQTQMKVIEFCAKHNLVLFADEVYQNNIYHADSSFVSFKKLLRTYEQQTGKRGPVLLSFHSVSKGFLGECGLRGGYVEVVNAPEEIPAQLYKLMSISLCSNTIGQLAVSVMVNPPKDESYKKDAEEKIATMARKGELVCKMLNACPHMHCQRVQGAMYAFPRLELPDRFL